MSRWLAIFFGAGLLKPAPGTWGSAVALGLGMLILHFAGFVALVVATVVVTALGFWACAVQLSPGQDPSEVVIDEVAGQWLTLLFPAAGFALAPAAQAAVMANGGWLPWPAWLFPFVLFRLFDIWKPGIIGRADRRGDPAGVMLDDLWAGLFAGVVTVILAAAYHVPLILMRHP
ncbi:phosphatidylglycerophosphatase A [bacterium]|nr:phosphatidylglycerophosphatase A [bacterium]